MGMTQVDKSAGKIFLARAVAGEAVVPFFNITGSNL